MPSSPIRDSSLRGGEVWKVGEDTVTVNCHKAQTEGFSDFLVRVDELPLMEGPLLEPLILKVGYMHSDTSCSPSLLLF